MTNPSTKPILNTTINKNKTYLGAFDVNLKILLGSKSLNILNLEFFFVISNMNQFSDQECRGEIIRLKLTFNILDQKILKYSSFVWPRFELNVVE